MMAAMNQSTIRAGAFLVIAIALIAGGYLYQNHKAALAAQASANTPAATSSPLFAPVTQGAAQSGSTNIIPFDNAPAQALYKQPQYSKTLAFSAKISSSEKAAMQKAYDEVVGDLAKDKMDYNAWISLGTLNLMAGNYKTSETIWNFASVQWPTNHASHNNLGDLYMNYLRDYPKAEKEYKAGIQNFPGDPNPYHNLFTLYTETSYKPTNTAAEDILKQGIAAVPKAPELQYLLAKYYVKLGRTQEAKSLYTAAYNNALSLDQKVIAAEIKKEMDAIK
jgi:tetratricopeptide (TPR) repeat protein